MHDITPFLKDGKARELTVDDFATFKGISFGEAKWQVKRMVDSRHLQRFEHRGTIMFKLRVS